ncbi:GMC family oxidoreductase [Pseudomonas sp. F1_0610]|uniref:GMC family oxidoreductase N-terminal domain-containing protein n=1 Tax=Pseudomonas sp. F1_0610 TaxID=3114284 RepID=UPI0039C22861
MAIRDIFQEGVDQGWNVKAGAEIAENSTIETDIVIVGSGAGGATTAEILAQAGFQVILIEEGPLRTSKDFKMLEHTAYTELYQEGLGRTSTDGAISILQGRAVGGSTLINWTSSFRTPEPTLQHWAQEWQVKGLSSQELQPWFENREQRLNIAPSPFPPNPNNEVLSKGCAAKGWHWQHIARNVKGCGNLGYCGMGCPLNAKQSMLVTTIPSLLQKNGQLIYSTCAFKLEWKNQRVQRLECRAIDAVGNKPSQQKFYIKAKHFVLAGGAINTPGILLRSKAPDPKKLCGKRTFLHLVNFSWAQFKHDILPFYGAPQTTYTDQFQWSDGVTGQMSYKLEVPPMQPSFAASLLTGFGEQQAALMRDLPRSNTMLSLLRDGFHPQSTGGTVSLLSDGMPSVDYPLNDYIWNGLRRAFISMAQIQLAAGANFVLPLHADAHKVTTEKAAIDMISNLDMRRFRVRLGSAHVMGGCSMSEDTNKGLINSTGQHHYLENLSIHDGSIFPTSIGANPQLSIYTISAKLSAELATRLNS